jgi:hypothetical protein
VRGQIDHPPADPPAPETLLGVAPLQLRRVDLLQLFVYYLRYGLSSVLARFLLHLPQPLLLLPLLPGLAPDIAVGSPLELGHPVLQLGLDRPMESFRLRPHAFAGGLYLYQFLVVESDLVVDLQFLLSQLNVAGCFDYFSSLGSGYPLVIKHTIFEVSGVLLVVNGS